MDVVDAGSDDDFDAEVLEALFGVLGEGGVEGFEEAVAGLDEEDVEFGGVDVSEVASHGEAYEVGEGAGEFDAGGASADEEDGHETPTFDGVGAEFGGFEGGEDAGSDAVSVSEGFESDGVFGPVVVAKEGGACSAGEDEVVEGVAMFFRGGDFGVGIDLGDGVEEDFDVVCFAEDAAEGSGDVGGGEGCGGDLIEEGLKEVVVFFVDEGDFEARVVGEFLGAGETGESATDDEDFFGSRHGWIVALNREEEKAWVWEEGEFWGGGVWRLLRG